ncbi:hypothetical protein IQ266_05820 [filamentous cyanobacterium LEGE 11480]|uniref:Uncharacterized protein n=1 Tax=Romeriopsis navalis LEGE 11480 TaxID=2777977 RepID=A0A928VIK6_9CYAN|nr:hypothetical protein [Romeriopsis navalis]MBE9029278.1 hypothetical protein [Romeriopsis navalis LEGE 11480]
MPRQTPYNLQLQLTRMYRDGQSFFAKIKVQEWLKERQENPADYDIVLHQRPAPPGSKEVMTIEVELRRLDGQPVEDWLIEALNYSK